MIQVFGILETNKRKNLEERLVGFLHARDISVTDLLITEKFWYNIGVKNKVIAS